MTGLLLIDALAGGLLAFAAVWLVARLRAAGRARALHELRGGLCVLRLSLEASGAVDRDCCLTALDRAERALNGLTGERTGPCRAQQLGPQVEALGRGLGLLAAKRGAELKIEVDERVRGRSVHPEALADAASNLIANAIEHGAGNVSVAVGERRGAVSIEVSDGGPGPILPARRALHRSRWNSGQRGHGLGIAVRSAQRAGGRIGRGSTFGALVIELPTTDGAA